MIFFLLFSHNLFSQSGNCEVGVPFYNVDLTGNPTGTYISPEITRSKLCCGETGTRCLEFQIKVDTATIAINFYIASGAIPTGSMYYQINCGTPVAVGSQICLTGSGPFTLTFCKPGGNANTYAIQAIARPTVIENNLAGVSCPANQVALGFIPSSLAWHDITSGNRMYDNYLTCMTGCDTVVAQPEAGFPAYVDFQVCGDVASPVCYGKVHTCDTTRVYFCSQVSANVTPEFAEIVQGLDSAELIGYYDEGVGPYSYRWKDMAGNIIGTEPTYIATAGGIYTYEVYDSALLRCPAVAKANVNSTPLAINLLYFEAKYNVAEKNVKLSWLTASETNNEFFSIQRSTNAVDFEDIVILKGAGNNNSILKYSYIDLNPPNRFVYYRLSYTDINGKVEYSGIVFVECISGENVFMAYPNPSSGNFTVIVPSGTASVQIFNACGKLLVDKSVSGQNSVDFMLKTVGMHFIQLTSDKQTINDNQDATGDFKKRLILYIVH